MDSPSSLFRSLPELLLHRRDSSAGLSFLTDDGDVVQSMSYSALYYLAREYAQRLLASGIQPKGNNVVIASFDNHNDHILLFWACCFAGVPFCPIPPLHPEPSRRTLFLNHLQTLFSKPILISNDITISIVKSLVPSFEAISWSDLQTSSFGQTFTPLSVYPEYQPNSDDVVSFMLTSGSTGNSKAAVLRHSNFLSCVRGKVKHHASSPSSRFLNWIAFDHVACVSEIHLQALLVDAWQYHVSPRAIIRNPRNLLEWTSKYKITYTFSPNFLIAQIVRDLEASPPPGFLDLTSVKAFISGGEAVPVKTAVEFTNILTQYGARRDVLRAGFGMTETCAGCIYDTREILCDASQYTSKYLSLGTCCDGVTIRVVNHLTGLPCAPLEEGQLQITGPSVFREYHNNAKATAESFVDEWFITGDTAVIDDVGNLHLMGRDKDCININGVKHPTIDVEHFIEDSQIDGIPRSYVYVCPMRLADADTETYGVFYQHELLIENEVSVEGLSRILATNRALKASCTLFCSQAPHIVLPLPRAAFIKTALGKVSRSFLANAYLKGNYEDIERKLKDVEASLKGECTKQATRTEKIIFEAISQLFDISSNDLKREMSLFDLGASSMHLIQLKQLLQERLAIPEIPTIEMLRRPEIHELASFLDTIIVRGSRSEVPYDPLVLLNPNGSKPPLFLIHPGVGEILIFMKLAKILEDDRPIYALRARGFDDRDKPFDTLEEMVDCYTDRIVAVHPRGPYYIAGYSFGGAVAFEITKKLEAQGRRVAWTGVLNLPPEIQFRMKELVWIEILINLLMFLALIPTSAFEEVKQNALKTFPELQGADTEPSSSDEIINYLFSLSDRHRLDELQLNMDEFRRWVNVAYQVTYCGRTYIAEGAIAPALMTVFCAIPLPSLGSRQEYKSERLSRWEGFNRSRFELVDVDGEHYTMISEDHVVSFAEKLRAVLARATYLLDLPPQLDAAIVDFSSSQDAKACSERLRQALENIGFGVLVNVPEFDEPFQREILALAERLFSKPQEWKDSLSVLNSSAFRGYLRAESQVVTEGYLFGTEAERTDLQQGPNQWPKEADLPNFQANMRLIFEKYQALSMALNDHICNALEIPTSAITSYLPSDRAIFRSGLWSHLLASETLVEDGPVEIHEYYDMDSFISLMIQSGPGLQVKNREGKWVDVPHIPGGVICMVGEQLVRLTGGRLVETPYRIDPSGLRQNRYTIPYALSTMPDKTVKVYPQLERSHHP